MKTLIVFVVPILIFGCTWNNQRKEAGYLIAYNVCIDIEADDYEIFIYDPADRSHINIINHPDVAWTYLGGKNKIYFISDRDTCTRCYFLYEYDVVGNKLSKIGETRLRDSWMGVRNGGDELIVFPHNSVDSGFQIIDRQGHRIRSIYPEVPSFNDPAFSPDGKKIVFRGGSKKSRRDHGFKENIYILNDDGSGLKQLTTYPPEDTTAPWFAYKAGPPRWNSKENFISFQSFRNGKSSLYRVDPDGSNFQRLTGLDWQEGWHDWSPDGTWLAIEIFDSAQAQFNIVLMNWQTRDFEMITDSSYKYMQAPVFVDLID